MTRWHSNSRTHPKKTAAAMLDLTHAYRAVFRGNPTSAQQQMVLADFAARCGWNLITLPRNASDRELWFAEGKRAAFSELFAHLSLSTEDVLDFENAARREAAILQS